MATPTENETGLNDAVENESFSISIRRDEIIAVDITLSTEVNLSFQYEKLFATLRSLPQNCTTVNLFLASFGGYMQGLVPLFNAFKYCQVPVDVYVTGECYSAGAMLALSGRSLTMMPNTMLMFHNSSGGEFGKGNELYDAVMHGTKHTRGVFKNMVTPFLSNAELEGLMHDKDTYIHWDQPDLQKRIRRHFNPKKEVKK